RIRIGGNRNRRWISDVLEDGVEHLPRELGEMAHERAEFAVEVANKEQGPFAENREARVMKPADGIHRAKQSRHHWRKLLRQHLCIGRRLQRKAEGKVVLAHCVISFTPGGGTPCIGCSDTVRWPLAG